MIGNRPVIVAAAVAAVADVAAVAVAAAAAAAAFVGSDVAPAAAGVGLLHF